MQAMIQQGAQQIQQQGAQLQAQYQQMEEQRLKIALLSTELANKAGANQAKQQELQIKGFDAQTRRIEAVRPEVVRMGVQPG